MAALLRLLGDLVRRTNRQTTDLVFLDLQGCSIEAHWYSAG